jgi:hypothetical protein
MALPPSNRLMMRTATEVETENNVSPPGDFEVQVLDCVKIAIRAMIGDGSSFSKNSPPK